MPVSKVKNETNYDIIIKSLRGREVPCLVVAVFPFKGPQKNTPSKTRDCEGQQNCQEISKLTNCATKMLHGGNGVQSTVPKKRTYSLIDGLASSTPTVETPKRAYRRKGVPNTVPYKRTKSLIDGLALSTPSVETPKRVYRRKGVSNTVPNKRTKSLIDGLASSTPAVETPKRAYRRKSLQLPAAKTQKQSIPAESTCLWMDDNANAPPTPLRKSSENPRVPCNTPVVFSSCRESESTSSLNHVCLSTPGRLAEKNEFLRDDESTCTGSNSNESWASGDASRGTPGRRRGRRIVWSPEPAEEETEVSEYELLRRKNIEENLKVLKEIFAETGFPFEKKPETPKIRRSYCKVPPPPPRPKSVRLEVKEPLDFSRLTQNLDLT